MSRRQVLIDVPSETGHTPDPVVESVERPEEADSQDCGRVTLSRETLIRSGLGLLLAGFTGGAEVQYRTSAGEGSIINEAELRRRLQAAYEAGKTVGALGGYVDGQFEATRRAVHAITYAADMAEALTGGEEVGVNLLNGRVRVTLPGTETIYPYPILADIPDLSDESRLETGVFSLQPGAWLIYQAEVKVPDGIVGMQLRPFDPDAFMTVEMFDGDPIIQDILSLRNKGGEGATPGVVQTRNLSFPNPAYPRFSVYVDPGVPQPR